MHTQEQKCHVFSKFHKICIKPPNNAHRKYKFESYHVDYIFTVSFMPTVSQLGQDNSICEPAKHTAPGRDSTRTAILQPCYTIKVVPPCHIFFSNARVISFATRLLCIWSFFLLVAGNILPCQRKYRGYLS